MNPRNRKTTAARHDGCDIFELVVALRKGLGGGPSVLADVSRVAYYSFTQEEVVAEGVPTAERLASAYKRLAESAERLSAASDSLAKPVRQIEFTLQELNIGLDTWHTMASGSNDDGYYWNREVGYVRLNDGWGLAIRSTTGHETNPDAEDTDRWRFNDAPRYLRVEAIDKLPDLLEGLIVNAEKTAKKLQDKSIEAEEQAAALKAAADEVKRERQRAKQTKEKR
ncbi:MAG: hypothetical protein QM736_18560 [Vicinamibacterales bacterium]